MHFTSIMLIQLPELQPTPTFVTAQQLEFTAKFYL